MGDLNVPMCGDTAIIIEHTATVLSPGRRPSPEKLYSTSLNYITSPSSGLEKIHHRNVFFGRSLP